MRVFFQSVNEEVQVETLKFVKDFAAQVETLPKSLLRQDAYLFDLQHMIKETRGNIDKLADLVLLTDEFEEIVSRAQVAPCNLLYIAIHGLLRY